MTRLCALGVPLVAWLGCSHPCPISAYCEGNVLQTCTPGSGLIPAKLAPFDCTQVYATCIDLGEGDAGCAEDPCNATEYLAADGGVFPFATNCVSNILFSCQIDPSQDAGLVVGQDCSQVTDIYGDVATCVDNGGGNAQCVLP